MLTFLDNHPVTRFFIEVFAMAAGTAVVVLLIGVIFDWSTQTAYSDGFFFACVVLAAIASSLAVLHRPPYPQKNPKNQPDLVSEPHRTGLAGFLVRRSFNFRMLVAALICLAISIVVAQ